MNSKKQFTLWLSMEERQLLRELARRWHVSQAAALRMLLVRETEES